MLQRCIVLLFNLTMMIFLSINYILIDILSKNNEISDVII